MNYFRRYQGIKESLKKNNDTWYITIPQCAKCNEKDMKVVNDIYKKLSPENRRSIIDT